MLVWSGQCFVWPWSMLAMLIFLLSVLSLWSMSRAALFPDWYSMCLCPINPKDSHFCFLHTINVVSRVLVWKQEIPFRDFALHILIFSFKDTVLVLSLWGNLFRVGKERFCSWQVWFLTLQWHDMSEVLFPHFQILWLITLKLRFSEDEFEVYCQNVLSNNWYFIKVYGDFLCLPFGNLKNLKTTIPSCYHFIPWKFGVNLLKVYHQVIFLKKTYSLYPTKALVYYLGFSRETEPIG